MSGFGSGLGMAGASFRTGSLVRLRLEGLGLSEFMGRHYSPRPARRYRAASRKRRRQRSMPWPWAAECRPRVRPASEVARRNASDGGTTPDWLQ